MTLVINKNGEMSWYNEDGTYHRDGDLPAIICSSGYMIFYKNGEYYRDGDNPSIISTSLLFYHRNGKNHRDGDLPARIHANGILRFYKNNKLTRNFFPSKINVLTGYDTMI